MRPSFFMKWILLSPGQYKLVEDNDPRPGVELKSRVHTGAPTIKFNPSWRKYEKSVHLLDGADKFTKERDHEIKTNPKAARWEKSRRESLQRQKHDWRNAELKKLREKGM